MKFKELAMMALAGILIGALAGPGVVLAEGYANDAFACKGGEGSEGYIALKSGGFSLTETAFVRAGPKKDLGNGWFEARYAVESEGEMQPAEKVRLKITPEQVWIEFVETGQKFTARAC